jgi:hypothetical protein
MSDQLYLTIVNCCLLLAIINAILFDHLGELRWLAGALGILAAIVSSAAYFIRHK